MRNIESVRTLQTQQQHEHGKKSLTKSDVINAKTR